MNFVEMEKYEKKFNEDYKKGLFWLGVLMKKAENIKDVIWEYQKDSYKSGLDSYDICCGQAFL